MVFWDRHEIVDLHIFVAHRGVLVVRGVIPEESMKWVLICGFAVGLVHVTCSRMLYEGIKSAFVSPHGTNREMNP